MRTPLVLAGLLLALGCSSSDPGSPGSSPKEDAGADAENTPDSADAATCTPNPEASENVTLENEFGTLGGVLELPAGCPKTVVLIVSGSGSTNRDGNVPGETGKTDVYRMVAEALRNEAGVATLRYDDEGIGASTSGAPSDVEDFRFDMEIADVAAWVKQLRGDSRFSHVVVAGHSQGSLTAILAAKTEPIDGWISLAGAGRPAGDLLHEQLSDDLTPAQLAELDAAIEKMENGELPGPVNPPLDQIIPPIVQPYLISWLKYDPKVEVASLTAPGIILQGTTDRQVKVLDAELLHEGKADAELVVVEDMCHPLKQATDAAGEQQAAYTDPTVPLATGLIPPITTFLHELDQP